MQATGMSSTLDAGTLVALHKSSWRVVPIVLLRDCLLSSLSKLCNVNPELEGSRIDGRAAAQCPWKVARQVAGNGAQSGRGGGRII